MTTSLTACLTRVYRTPLQIFTLIRSHSPTRRQDPQTAVSGMLISLVNRPTPLQVHPEPRADSPDHADLQNNSQTPVSMSTQTTDERPSRKFKSENRVSHPCSSILGLHHITHTHSFIISYPDHDRVPAQKTPTILLPTLLHPRCQ